LILAIFCSFQFPWSMLATIFSKFGCWVTIYCQGVFPFWAAPMSWAQDFPFGKNGGDSLPFRIIYSSVNMSIHNP
jgi:hypothetical protein